MASKYPSMNWDSPNLPETFKLFKQKMVLVCEDNEVTEDEKIARKIKIGLGDEGLSRLNVSGLPEDEKKKPDKLWQFFENQLRVSVNFRIHRLSLMQYRQKEGESLDEFVNRARSLAQQCNFTEQNLQERIIELIIASTPMEPYRRELLGKGEDITLDDVIKLGRQHEAAFHGAQQIESLYTPKSGVDLHAIKTNPRNPCMNCGQKHKFRSCPAYNSECDYCGNKGHWRKYCRKLKRQEEKHQKRGDEDQKRRKPRKPQTYNKHVDICEESSESEEECTTTFDALHDDANIDAITSGKALTKIPIKIPEVTGKCLLKVKLDTGANANALPLRTYRQMYGDQKPSNLLSPSTTRLTSYSGDTISSLGILEAQCQGESGNWFKTGFHVVDVPGPVLLGLPSCEQLGLVSINCERLEVDSIDKINSIEELKTQYPGQFDKIGQFKDPAKILIRDDAEPRIDRPRKHNINLLPKIKEELHRMESLDIIRRVNQHTDWCSSLVYSTKKDGSIRVCLDPRHLNNAIKRCPHKIPTLEEINPKFVGAKIFSKLDAKAGYWSVPIAEESQLLTTFRTPIGRFCFKRLPFGLNISQDIFQQRMDEILENLEGCASIADDICVFGKTEEEHDQNLRALMEAAKTHGLVFNSDKCTIKAPAVSFFGNTYSREGISPDPAKISDVQSMNSPETKGDLQRFLGLLTYLGMFIPNLSTRAAPLRDLLKDNTPFKWEEDHEHTFQALKMSITPRSITYYDVNKPLELEVDASMKGLGACLTQNGKPVAFASKTLTPTQSNYSNIEREMLAVVQGVERFHTYLYGRAFTIVTDHKPLEIICRKPITAAPPRLQRMLLRIQGYDYRVRYQPGEKMIISDTLSRLPNPHDADTVELDMRVDDISLDLINFSDEKKELLQAETRKCPTLNALIEVIYQGWPNNIKELPCALRQYWNYRDTLGIENGVIFKGKQVVIPESLQKDLLIQLHEGHQGIEKTKLLAKETVYWPKINEDIARMVNSCPPCQENQHANRNELLLQTEITPAPWQLLGTDLFELKGHDFIILSDYFSKFPVIREIHSPVNSLAVITFMEEICGLFGAPKEIRSDNGPQYSCEQFKTFCQKWGIKHTTSSPHYPQSNGFIERQIGWLKPIIKKCLQTNQSIITALFHIRATPVSNSIPPPTSYGKKDLNTPTIP